MSYLKNKKESQCSGCGACIAACPKKCIVMQCDSEGFKYPYIDLENCIHCDKCVKVCEDCTNYKEFGKEYKQKAFIGIHNSLPVLERSSSGGAFSAICEAFSEDMNLRYAFFGCMVRNKYEVIYDYVESYNQIDCFRKSKYVQADTRDSFLKVRELLNQGVYVLFSGTPCIVAGLRSFLGKEYNNLLCVDLVCHGVPSQNIFKDHIAWLEKKQKDSIVYFGFKNKKAIDSVVNTRTAYIQYESGKNSVVSLWDDVYLKGYYSRLFYRKSCMECPYACSSRVGDITVADAWGFEGVIDGIEPVEGISAVICNSSKGEAIYDKLGKYMKIHPVEVESVIERNEQLRKPTKCHVHRNIFFRLYKITHNVNLSVKVAMFSVKVTIKKIIKKILPDFLVEKLKQGLKRA